MLVRFLNALPRDVHSVTPGEQFDLPTFNNAVSELFASCAGASFGDGLYRVVKPEDVSDWNATVASAFPSFQQRITCFAFDWLGRVFAADARRCVNGRAAVTIFEPGIGQSLATPCDVEAFHEQELIDYRDAALAEPFFLQWIASGGSGPDYSQCLGYRRPLFLGGEDSIDNLELTDLDVYWTISAQLIEKTRRLPEGTRLNIKGS